MALRIHVVPSGESVHVPSPVPPSIEDLKKWIERTLRIVAADQILLTAKGQQLRPKTFLVERELFLYDRAVFSPSATALNDVDLHPLPDLEPPSAIPTSIADPKDIKAWQALFQERRKWTDDLLNRCKALQRSAEELLAQRSVIERGVRLAATSREAPIKTTEKELAQFKVDIEETTRDTMTKAKTIDADYEKLLKIPALPAFGKFFVGQGMTGGLSRRRSDDSMITLAALIDGAAARSAAAESRRVLSGYGIQVKDYEVSIQKLYQQLEELQRGLDVAQSRSLTEQSQEPGKLIAEIQAVAAKVHSDCNEVLKLSADQRSVSQASRLALFHTKNLLPGLQEIQVEMNDLLRFCVEQKNASVVRAADILQMVATVESQQTTLQRAIRNLHMTPEDWRLIDRAILVSEIPIIYGALLVEAIRRHEWIHKMKRDSASLAEEIAGYQDEESKRRKRWLQEVKEFVPEGMDGAVLGVEINLHGDESAWPLATRQDLDDYLSTLKGMPGLSKVINDLNNLVEEMDKPTRQQVKRVKTFKNGSVHEAGFGKGSLLLRGEDETRVLKEVVTKLEDELKSNKSRVRKLEDLLHRQSQISRASAPNQLPSQNQFHSEANLPSESERSPTVTSPRLAPALGSRRPSVASRRLSNQLSDDKTIVRRMLQLENELAEERQAKAALEKDLKQKDQEIQTIWDELQEANSTKKDIMENMDAHQREFGIERKALEAELGRHKIRVEEVEDEMDRLIGSRENERLTAEQVVAKMEQARKAGADELQTLERQLADRVTGLNNAQTENNEYLHRIFTILAASGDIPQDHQALLQEVESAAIKSTGQATELARTIAMIRSEKDSLQQSLDAHRLEKNSLDDNRAKQEAEMNRLTEELASEKSRAETVSAELDGERSQLRQLRDKLVDGESGSDSLRRQLALEEEKVSRLTSDLTDTKSHVNSLDVELLTLQSRYKAAQSSSKANAIRLEHRGQRAKELTSRLYKQKEQLLKLLDDLGFAVTHDGEKMGLQRASKLGTSSILPDQSGQISLPIVMTSPAKRLLNDLSDLSSLLWMEKDSEKDEAAKFEEFLSKVDKFDLRVFCTEMHKRMRDVEHTARKWAREARAYRDKSRKHQSDAHDKIAFRSFKEGDLALFLPTRNQVTRSWAAFNVGAPHYFLREHDNHRLANKEWLVARISKIEDRVVDLSKAMGSTRGVASTGDVSESINSFDDDNPFDLSDGLRWYLLDAQEEKSGAPSTPGLGKTTVASANVDATGSIRTINKRPGETNDEVSRQLSKSLDSRRSSTNSRKSVQIAAAALGIHKPVSNEALVVDSLSPAHSPPTATAAGKSLKTGHFRSTSQTSSLRNVQNTSDQDPAVPTTVEQQAAGGGPSIGAEELMSVAVAAPSQEESANHKSELATSPLRSPIAALKSIDGTGRSSPSKTQRSSPSKSTQSPSKSVQSPPKSTQSPSKSMQSPAKANGREGGGGGGGGSVGNGNGNGTWNSLWQFGISLESGGKKK